MSSGLTRPQPTPQSSPCSPSRTRRPSRPALASFPQRLTRRGPVPTSSVWAAPTSTPHPSLFPNSSDPLPPQVLHYGTKEKYGGAPRSPRPTPSSRRLPLPTWLHLPPAHQFSPPPDTPPPAHMDAFFDKRLTTPELGGERVATCLMFLNEPLEGGETCFPNVPARRGGGCISRRSALSPPPPTLTGLQQWPLRRTAAFRALCRPTDVRRLLPPRDPTHRPGAQRRQRPSLQRLRPPLPRRQAPRRRRRPLLVAQARRHHRHGRDAHGVSGDPGGEVVRAEMDPPGALHEVPGALLSRSLFFPLPVTRACFPCAALLPPPASCAPVSHARCCDGCRRPRTHHHHHPPCPRASASASRWPRTPTTARTSTPPAAPGPRKGSARRTPRSWWCVTCGGLSPSPAASVIRSHPPRRRFRLAPRAPPCMLGELLRGGGRVA